MFAAVRDATLPTLTLDDLGQPPPHVRTYVLPDEAGVLDEGGSVHEYDLTWTELPDDLPGIVRRCIESALRQGSPAVWFGFEGSFDFEHLLSRDIAEQIYAVGSADGVELALADEHRGSERWRERLDAVRQSL